MTSSWYTWFVLGLHIILRDPNFPPMYFTLRNFYWNLYIIASYYSAGELWMHDFIRKLHPASFRQSHGYVCGIMFAVQWPEVTKPIDGTSVVYRTKQPKQKRVGDGGNMANYVIYKNTLETCKNPRPTSVLSELPKSCTTLTMNFHTVYFSWIPQNVKVKAIL